MKKYIFLLIFIHSIQCMFSQSNVILKDSIKLDADHFVGIDSFEGIYYTKNNIFYKKWNQRSWQFGDFTLGPITSVSIINPLKIILFYEASNTGVIVDKYLTEINRINFNTLPNFKNVSAISAANDNNVWIFDTNSQQLELFDTNSTKTLITTQPIAEIPLSLTGNFNYCWIVTTDKISTYNIYGSLVTQFDNTGFTDIKTHKNTIIALKNNNLYYLTTSLKNAKKIILPEIPIKQFYVTNEILYIYDQTTIYSFNLNLPKK